LKCQAPPRSTALKNLGLARGRTRKRRLPSKKRQRPAVARPLPARVTTCSASSTRLTPDGSDALPQRGAEGRAARPAEPPGPDQIAAVDALCLSYNQASAVLGYSPDHFRRYAAPDLRVIAKGRRNTVSRAKLISSVGHIPR